VEARLEAKKLDSLLGDGSFGGRRSRGKNEAKLVHPPVKTSGKCSSLGAGRGESCDNKSNVARAYPGGYQLAEKDFMCV